MKPALLVAAVPVIPRETIRAVEKRVDALVALEKPASFSAVGEFYVNFEQIGDGRVRELLKSCGV